MSTSEALKCPWPAVAQEAYKFVGFIDILGFSNRVLTDSDSVIAEYQYFCELLLDWDADLSVEVTVYSDAIMVVSDKLADVATLAQTVWFFALNNHLVVRGGISYGRFWNKQHAKGMMVVSEALVRAVQMEKEIGHPAIVFDQTIDFPDEFWAEQLANPPGLIDRPVIHFDGWNIVNPFNSFWFRTARTRMLTKLEEATHPKHRAKYEWFLKLWDAVNEYQPLAPDGVAERLIDSGVLEFVPFDQASPPEFRRYRISPDDL